MKLGLGLGIGMGGGGPRVIRPWFNGMVWPGDLFTFTGGPNAALDYAGVLQPGASNVPSVEGARWTGTAWVTTDTEGAELFEYEALRGKPKYTDYEYKYFAARTNLLTYSQDFSNAVWFLSAGVSVNSNAATAPNNTLTADKLVPSTGGAFVEVYQNCNVISGQKYAQKFYIKEAGLQYIQIISTGVVFGSYCVNFDLINGLNTLKTVADAVNLGCTIKKLGGGFCEITVTAQALSTSSFGRFALNFIKTATTGRGVDEGAFDGASGIYVWQGQLETGTEATWDIETTSATVTKPAGVYNRLNPLYFKRALIEPSRTNYFLNSATPATQNITTTAQQYTISVLGTGSVTLSGTATGVVTAGSPLTVTATAGTLICTVSGTLTHAQVEAGAFATSPITTAGATVTRPADVLSHPSAGVLRGNGIGGIVQFIPKATGQTGCALNSYVDANNGHGLYVEPTQITFRKTAGGVNTDCTVSYTHAEGVPVQLIWVQTTAGMKLKERHWLGLAWSTWSSYAEVTTAAGKADLQIGSTFQIGSSNGSTHLCGNYQLSLPVWKSDPTAYLEELVA